MTIKVPFFSYQDVGRYAENFLKKYHQTLELPIPIEWIIESNLELHIVPINNLYRDFCQSGFLSADRTKIFIDEYQYDNYIEKYRFTLAHEVGHYVLHKSLYEGVIFKSEQEYFEFLQSIPQNELFWYETQGNWFAAQLLVPTPQLEKSCITLLESNCEQFSDGKQLSHEFWSYASNVLAEPFEVSPIVVEIRIDKENLIEKYKNYYQEK